MPIAPATADAMSERVEVMTRAVNVEALKLCSAPTMKYASSARAVPRVGPLAGELVQEPRDRSSDGSGSIGSLPARSRAKAASADGENAVSARACSTVGGHGRSCVAPHADTAVRSASIGLASAGSARRTVEDRGRDGPVGSRWRGSHSPVHSRLATAGYVPRSTRSPIR